MKKVVLNVGIRYIQIATLQNNKLLDFYVEDLNEKSKQGNIYLGIASDVVKKLDTVFVEIGEEKKAYIQKRAGLPMPKQGEKILCQILKEETESKGAVITKDLTFIGRYVVLIREEVNTTSSLLFSNDLDKEEIGEIKEKIKGLNFDKQDKIIIRREAALASSEEILADYLALKGRLQKIDVEYRNLSVATLLYKKSMIDTIFTEIYDKDVEEIVTDDAKLYQELLENAKSYQVDPKKIKRYEDKELGILELYKVEQEVKKALGKYVWLKSGGQILIEHTEAMTVIDVNTKKFEGKKELEESALKVNLEAATEIARQIRLRNISGIILIDFINMKNKENSHKVLDEFKRLTLKDKQKVHILGFTKLGLLETTRQKKRKMLKDILKKI